MRRVLERCELRPFAADDAPSLARLANDERVSAELGYWLGAPFRGRGVMSEAIRAFTDDSFERFSLTRIFALPFVHNTASCRALEKAAFTLEGTLRRSAIKDGQITDQRLYARVCEPQR